MIILGLILLAIGFVAHISILWTVGIILLVIGVILPRRTSFAGMRAVAVETRCSVVRGRAPATPLAGRGFIRFRDMNKGTSFFEEA
ncbi:hypothetical protein [Rhodococcus opacus]|uniref:hypothetical protein n=1 Tax=Rhodococcus opacus TaxID=37919 RepID=UPI00155A76C9|nr:hypothetical protein [Rhodococcus opacus]